MVNYMQVFFIRESNKNSLFKRIFKPIEIKQNIIIMNFKKKKRNTKFKIKNIKEILKILEHYNCKNVIISKNLKKDKIFTKLLQDNNIQINNGEYLYKNILDIIIKKTSIDNNIKLENARITIISNNLDPWLKNFIEIISAKCKMLGILTYNSVYFSKLVNNIWEKYGTIITVTNNKKKSLYKSDIIINLDLNEDQINKYSIYEKSIIISFKKNIKIHKKRFNGKIINNFEIELNKNSKIYKELITEEYSYYDIIDLAEVYLLNNKKEIINISINSLK